MIDRRRKDAESLGGITEIDSAELDVAAAAILSLTARNKALEEALRTVLPPSDTRSQGSDVATFSPVEMPTISDETGWLVEESASGVIHWIALAENAWPRTKENRFSRRFGFKDYLSPIVRVKDANNALRFARKQDAEAFIRLFDRFLLCPIATEHCWHEPAGLNHQDNRQKEGGE
jgi:hypothetical protein